MSVIADSRSICSGLMGTSLVGAALDFTKNGTTEIGGTLSVRTTTNSRLLPLSFAVPFLLH
jgi:hypothetical protein